MSYRLDVSDFLEIMKSPQHISTDISIEKNSLPYNVTINEQIIKKDLCIVETNYCINKELILDCAIEEPCLELHFNLSNTAIHYQNHIIPSEKVAPMTGNLIYLAPTTQKSTLLFEKEVKYQTFDIHFPLHMLNEYWGEHHLLDIFLTDVAQNKGVGLTNNTIKFTAKMLSAVQDIRNCVYTGLTRKIYLEAKVREIIAYCFEEDTTIQTTKLSTRDIDCIQHVAYLITENINHPLTIEALALQAGINQTKLKSGFKTIFGTTVFGYLQEIRMRKAQQFLLEKELSIAEISEKCGYLNVSNFSNAFKKYFGIAPTVLRKN
ncbi:MAG: AraC family transcriptional regulator [Flavobacteriaceae bacterium]|jgi:AraC-like DNA-binding protein|nr:AraC family transcriptional regulator [Flavobacteriaceae bacterium]